MNAFKDEDRPERPPQPKPRDPGNTPGKSTESAIEHRLAGEKAGRSTNGNSGAVKLLQHRGVAPAVWAPEVDSAIERGVRGAWNNAYDLIEFDDLLQHTRLEIVLLSNKEDIRSCSATAFTIARREVVDRMKVKVRRGGLVSLPPGSAAPTKSNSAHDQPDLASDVWRAVENLGEPEASMVVARYHSCKKGKELAAIYGVTEERVSVRVREALNRLKSMLGDYAE